MSNSANALTRVATAGLVIGAVGIAILWASGVEFPFYPPPGVIILGCGAIFLGVAGTRWWGPAAAEFLAVFVLAGFMISGIVNGDGFDNLILNNGTGPFLGQAIQLIGVLTALVAGHGATRAIRQHRRSSTTQAHEQPKD